MVSRSNSNASAVSTDQDAATRMANGNQRNGIENGSPLASIVARGFTSINNTARAFSGGKVRSWMESNLPAPTAPSAIPKPSNRTQARTRNKSTASQGPSANSSKNNEINAENTLPSPAPSNSPPGLEHRELGSNSANGASSSVSFPPITNQHNGPTFTPAVTNPAPQMTFDIGPNLQKDVYGVAMQPQSLAVRKKRPSDGADPRPAKRPSQPPFALPPNNLNIQLQQQQQQQQQQRRAPEMLPREQFQTSQRTASFPLPSPALQSPGIPSPSQVLESGFGPIRTPLNSPGLPKPSGGQSADHRSNSPFQNHTLLTSLYCLADPRNELNKWEQHRIALLDNAVKLNDHSYLILHQIYLSHSILPATLFASAIGEEYIPGLELIQDLLGPNTTLSPDLQLKLSQWPTTLRTANPGILEEVKLFLRGGYKRLQEFYKLCRATNQPPSAEAIQATLPFISPTLVRWAERKMSAVITVQQQRGRLSNAMAVADNNNGGVPQQQSNNNHPSVMQSRPMNTTQMQQQQGMNGTVATHRQAMNGTPIVYNMHQQSANGSLPSPGAQGMVSPGMANIPRQPSSNSQAPNNTGYFTANPAYVQQNQYRLAQTTAPPQQYANTQAGYRYYHGMMSQLSPTSPAMPAPQWPSNMHTQPHQAQTQPIPHQGTSQQFHHAGISNNLATSQGRALPQPQQPVPSQAMVAPNRLQPPPVSAQAPAPIPYPPLLENLLEIHLSSPMMTLNPLSSERIDPGKLYISLSRMPLGRLKVSYKMTKEQWMVDPEEERCLSRMLTAANPGEPPRRNMVSPGSLIYKLRCVEVKEGEKPPENDSEWVLKESVWPQSVFIELNGQRVEIRRKVKWGRDLAVDITNFIQVGTNILTFVQVGGRMDQSKCSYYMGVEAYLCQHEDALRYNLTNHQYRDAKISKAEILRRLSSKEDDDLIVSSSTVTVSICCPMSFTAIKLPVKGKNCLHLECFDFDTYLMSRPRGPGPPNKPPLADAYRCPNCGGDARPSELVIDGFFDEVLKSMRAQPGKYENVKSIVIDDKGEWAPKLEEENEPTLKGKRAQHKDARRVSVTSPGMAVTKEVEVICLDDD